MDQPDMEKGQLSERDLRTDLEQDDITTSDEQQQQTPHIHEIKPLVSKGIGRPQVLDINLLESIRARPIKKIHDDDRGMLRRFVGRYRRVILREIYMTSIGIVMAIPIIIVCVYPPAQKAEIGGVPLVLFFIWLEVPYVSFWASLFLLKLLYAIAPYMVTNRARGYCRYLPYMQLPLAYVGGSFAAFVSFYPLMHRDNPWNGEPSKGQQHWQYVLRQLLASTVCGLLVYAVKCAAILAVQVHYFQSERGRKKAAYNADLRLLENLLSISRRRIPDFYVRELGPYDTLLFNDVTSDHDAVAKAIKNPRSADILARRIWISFVQPGKEEIEFNDFTVIFDQEGGHAGEAREHFRLFDMDDNGAISEDEAAAVAVMLGLDIGALEKGFLDPYGPVETLDWLLLFTTLILVTLIYIAFLTESLAFTGTLLAGAGFAFSGTIQDLMTSIMFIFVRRPYDRGNLLKVDGVEYIVYEIGLLHTVLRTASNLEHMHVGNSQLSAMSIRNLTRSREVKETVRLEVNFSTSFEDVAAFSQKMSSWVKENPRHFSPDSLSVVVRTVGMEKLELEITVRYRGLLAADDDNRTDRKTTFLRQIVDTLRMIPIYGPGSSSEPTLGTAGNASYSVSVSTEEADRLRTTELEEVASKRYKPAAVE